MEVSITGSTVRVYMSHLEASQLGQAAVSEAMVTHISAELSDHAAAVFAGEETPTERRARERAEAREAAAKPKAK